MCGANRAKMSTKEPSVCIIRECLLLKYFVNYLLRKCKWNIIIWMQWWKTKSKMKFKPTAVSSKLSYAWIINQLEILNWYFFEKRRIPIFVSLFFKWLPTAVKICVVKIRKTTASASFVNLTYNTHNNLDYNFNFFSRKNFIRT